VKNVRTAFFSWVFCKFFSLWPEQFLLRVGDREAMQTKVTAGKTLKRAGATPLFGGPSAQKFVESLPPSRSLRSTTHGKREQACC
jgi:hypothetical protein